METTEYLTLGFNDLKPEVLLEICEDRPFIVVKNVLHEAESFDFNLETLEEVQATQAKEAMLREARFRHGKIATKLSSFLTSRPVSFTRKGTRWHGDAMGQIARRRVFARSTLLGTDTFLGGLYQASSFRMSDPNMPEYDSDEFNLEFLKEQARKFQHDGILGKVARADCGGDSSVVIFVVDYEVKGDLFHAVVGSSGRFAATSVLQYPRELC